MNRNISIVISYEVILNHSIPVKKNYYQYFIKIKYITVADILVIQKT